MYSEFRRVDEAFVEGKRGRLRIREYQPRLMVLPACVHANARRASGNSEARLA